MRARCKALEKASLAEHQEDIRLSVSPEFRSRTAVLRRSQFICSFLPSAVWCPNRHGPWDGASGQHHDQRLRGDIVQSNDGETLMVKYKDGEKKIIVTPQTMIAAAAAW